MHFKEQAYLATDQEILLQRLLVEQPVLLGQRVGVALTSVKKDASKSRNLSNPNKRVLTVLREQFVEQGENSALPERVTAVD